MQLNELKQNTRNKLTENNISAAEACIETEILLNYVFGVTKKDLILKPQIILEKEKLEIFNSLLEKRIKERIPVQYLTHKAYFMGEEFFVDENVLIPRPETEILVEEVIRNFETDIKHPKVLDIGTGSGCIACVLAKSLVNSEILACDISEKALNIAKINAKNLKLENKINFILSDIFENIDKSLKFDIIVSNPPYIPKKDKSMLEAEVLFHEPHNALFADDEKGLYFYEKIALNATNYLAPKGFLAVEIGINQERAVSEIFEKVGFEKIEIINDYNKIPRVIIAKY